MASLGAASACSLLTFITPPPAFTASPPSHCSPLISSQHIWRSYYGTQCIAACKTFTFNHQPADLLLQSWSRARKKKNPTKIRGNGSKISIGLDLLFWISARRAGRLVSLRSTSHHLSWCEDKYSQVQNDAHQREGAGRVTHASRRKWSERRPASQASAKFTYYYLMPPHQLLMQTWKCSQDKHSRWRREREAAGGRDGGSLWRKHFRGGKNGTMSRGIKSRARWLRLWALTGLME